MAAILDAFASKLAGILADMAKEEVEMLLGVPGEITKLETTLSDLSSILGDAERRRVHDSSSERWVRELKDARYDVDDILDLCQIMEGGEDPSSGCWSMPKMFFCFRNPVVAHEIGKKIQALNQRLEDLERRSSRFGFITQAINSSGYSINKASNSLSYKTGSVILESDVVGEKIVEDTKKIVDLLNKKVDATPVGLKGRNVVTNLTQGSTDEHTDSQINSISLAFTGNWEVLGTLGTGSVTGKEEEGKGKAIRILRPASSCCSPPPPDTPVRGQFVNTSTAALLLLLCSRVCWLLGPLEVQPSVHS